MSSSTILIEIEIEADVVAARQAGRDLAMACGFREVDCSKLTTAISELARNIFLYAGAGTIEIRALDAAASRRGIEVVATDSGPGIADLDLAMRDGYSTSEGLGLGLPGTKRLMDEFEIRSEVGRGSRIRVALWLV